MLDTVLQIGKAFRESKDAIKHHRYIRACPQDTEKEKVLRLSIPVREDFSFDLENITEITNQNEYAKLFYLQFKTSDNDGSPKYIFGDIYYKRNKKEKESGNYRTSLFTKKSAFLNGKKYIKGTQNHALEKFNNVFESLIVGIDEMLIAQHNVFLHFDFEGKHWYEIGVFEDISKIMIDKFTKSVNHGYVFDSMLYRTLCSGDTKNDIQFPMFLHDNKYKSRVFNEEDVNNLFYGINYTENPAIKPYNLGVPNSSDKIKIVVLPRESADNSFVKKLTAEDYINFNLNREDIIESTYKSGNSDWLFSTLTEQVAENILAFDVIFVKEGSNVDSDLLEITGIERSFLSDIQEKIDSVRAKLYQTYGRRFFIINSIKNILNDNSKSLKKYQKYLFDVLPKIYSATYYDDAILLPAVITKIEYTIRNPEDKNKLPLPNKINQLLQDFQFITKIQNKSLEGENLMKILESQSYKVGILLGKLAQNFAGQSTPIRSFEKNYVGNLSRRISSLDNLIDLKRFIEEKLIMHDLNYERNRQTSLLLAEAVKGFSARYDKNECAFGFFESYFASFQSKENTKNEEPIITTNN